VGEQEPDDRVALHVVLGAEPELGEALVLSHERVRCIGDRFEDALQTGAIERLLQVLDDVELDAPVAQNLLHAARLASAGIVVDEQPFHISDMTDRILTVNIVASTCIFYVAARLYVLPKLRSWSFEVVMPPILLLHSFRHLGLMFLMPGAVHPGMPAKFAYPAAFGDLLAALLASAALVAVVRRHAAARPLAWAFNLEGTADLLNATVLATVTGAPIYMGAAYWIPAFWVPALLVTHWITFLVLLRARG
jgi:hypothetical protein